MENGNAFALDHCTDRSDRLVHVGPFPGREQEFVVVAAGEGGLRFHAGGGGHRLQRQSHPHAARTANVPEVSQQPVGDVDGGRRLAS